MALDGRLEEACDYLERAWRQLSETDGESCVDVAYVSYRLAVNYVGMNLLGKALPAIDQAIAIFSQYKYFKAEHSRALFHKSRIHRYLGESGEAKTALHQCFEIRRQIVPNETKPPVFLTQEDFNRLVVLWHR